MLANTYPLLDIFLTLLVAAGFIVWLALVILVLDRRVPVRRPARGGQGGLVHHRA